MTVFSNGDGRGREADRESEREGGRERGRKKTSDRLGVVKGGVAQKASLYFQLFFSFALSLKPAFVPFASRQKPSIRLSARYLLYNATFSLGWLGSWPDLPDCNHPSIGCALFRRPRPRGPVCRAPQRPLPNWFRRTKLDTPQSRKTHHLTSTLLPWREPPRQPRHLRPHQRLHSDALGAGGQFSQTSGQPVENTPLSFLLPSGGSALWRQPARCGCLHGAHARAKVLVVLKPWSMPQLAADVCLMSLAFDTSSTPMQDPWPAR